VGDHLIEYSTVLYSTDSIVQYYSEPYQTACP